jgi:hypothetical protein
MRLAHTLLTENAVESFIAKVSADNVSPENVIELVYTGSSYTSIPCPVIIFYNTRTISKETLIAKSVRCIVLVWSVLLRLIEQRN